MRERTNELTRAHREVRENEERLRMALEVARIGAWEWDLGSGQMRWSADPERLFGFPEGSFGRDQRIMHAIHPDDRPRAEAAISAALRSGIYEAEYRVVRTDGSIAWITERGRVFSDGDGGANGRHQPRRDLRANGLGRARAPVEERTARARRSGTAEPAERRVPRDPQPRAQDADERDPRLDRDPDLREVDARRLLDPGGPAAECARFRRA